MDMVDMAIMDIMERERLRLKLLLLLSQDTTMAIMDMVDMAIMDIMERERLRLELLLLLSQDTTMAIMDMVDMAIMDIMERERLRLNQDITIDILITVDMDMVIMAREKLRQLLSPSLVIIIMDIPIMEV